MLPLLHPAATSARASMSGYTCRIRNKESVCLSGCVAAVSAGAHRASCGGTRTSPLLEPSAKANAAKAKSRIAWRGAGRRMMRDGAPRRAAEAMRAASLEKRKRLLGGEGRACCKFCEVQCHGASLRLTLAPVGHFRLARRRREPLLGVGHAAAAACLARKPQQAVALGLR